MLYPHPIIERGASLKDGYRYTLWRVWNQDLPRILFVMLNPSMADMHRDDRTLSRCIAFAQSWEGYGSLELVNLFALITPFPQALKQASMPIGDENNAYIQKAVARADRVVVAWGIHGSHLERNKEVLALLPERIWCLGTTKEGAPRHPLRLSNTTTLLPFQPVLSLPLRQVKEGSEVSP